jgi:putative membrane protein
MRLLIRWLINAIALIVVSRLISGFRVDSFTDALIAAAVFGIVNSTLGLVLKILTFPLTIVTFGLFLIVINAAMLKFAAHIVRGFVVETWGAAFIGAILLSLITAFLHWLIKDERRTQRY